MARVPNHHIDPPTDSELETIRKIIRTGDIYCNNPAGDFLRHRDETLIFFAAETGLRPGELLNLRWNDIDWEKNLIYVNPYNNKQRECQPALLSDKARNILLEYKRHFDSLLMSQYIFISVITMLPITPSAFARKYRRVFEKAGIRRVLWFNSNGRPVLNCRPYSLRKYWGTKLYYMTGDTHVVKRGLRHKHLSSQEPYVQTNDELIRKKINNLISEF